MNVCPLMSRASLIVLAAQLPALQTMIGSIEKRLIVQHRASEASKRLQSIPGGRDHWGERYCRHCHGPQVIPVEA